MQFYVLSNCTPAASAITDGFLGTFDPNVPPILQQVAEHFPCGATPGKLYTFFLSQGLQFHIAAVRSFRRYATFDVGAAASCACLAALAFAPRCYLTRGRDAVIASVRVCRKAGLLCFILWAMYTHPGRDGYLALCLYHERLMEHGKLLFYHAASMVNQVGVGSFGLHDNIATHSTVVVPSA